MNILIYGYGWSGQSMLEFLENHNQDKKLNIKVYDDNLSPFIRDSRVVYALDEFLGGGGVI